MTGIISNVDIASPDIDGIRRKKVYCCGLLLILAAGCSTASPTAPGSTGARSTYAGEWRGESTGFGGGSGTINFTVSGEGRVTSITVSSTVNGCPITRTLSGLSLEIVSQPQLLPSFDYGNSALLQQTNAITVQGTFLPIGDVSGLTSFLDYMGCGSGSFVWSARRR